MYKNELVGLSAIKRSKKINNARNDTALDTDGLVKYLTKQGMKAQYSGASLYKIGEMRVQYSGSEIYKIGDLKIQYSGNKYYKIGEMKVYYSGNKIYKIGDTKL